MDYVEVRRVLFFICGRIKLDLNEHYSILEPLADFYT